MAALVGWRPEWGWGGLEGGGLRLPLSLCLINSTLCLMGGYSAAAPRDGLTRGRVVRAP